MSLVPNYVSVSTMCIHCYEREKICKMHESIEVAVVNRLKCKQFYDFKTFYEISVVSVYIRDAFNITETHRIKYAY